MSTPRELLRECAARPRLRLQADTDKKPPASPAAGTTPSEPPAPHALYRSLMQQHDRVHRRESG